MLDIRNVINLRPFKAIFISENSQKSQGAKSDEQEGWFNFVIHSSATNSRCFFCSSLKILGTFLHKFSPSPADHLSKPFSLFLCSNSTLLQSSAHSIACLTELIAAFFLHFHNVVEFSFSGFSVVFHAFPPLYKPFMPLR